jgi:hypothetical protein
MSRTIDDDYKLIVLGGIKSVVFHDARKPDAA